MQPTTTIILATGPSLSQSQILSVHAAHLQKRAAVIVVNDAFKLAPWADVLYAADAQWWKVNAQAALMFAGRKVSCDAMVPYGSVRRLRQTGLEGYDPTPGCVRTGGNSGYQALHLAIQEGAQRVLLLGYDMGGTHFFGRHLPPLRNTDAATFERWAERFSALNGRGAEIINCTPGSAIKCFPTASLDEALRYNHQGARAERELLDQS